MHSDTSRKTHWSDWDTCHGLYTNRADDNKTYLLRIRGLAWKVNLHVFVSGPIANGPWRWRKNRFFVIASNTGSSMKSEFTCHRQRSDLGRSLTKVTKSKIKTRLCTCVGTTFGYTSRAITTATTTTTTSLFFRPIVLTKGVNNTDYAVVAAAETVSVFLLVVMSVTAAVGVVVLVVMLITHARLEISRVHICGLVVYPPPPIPINSFTRSYKIYHKPLSTVKYIIYIPYSNIRTEWHDYITCELRIRRLAW